MPEHSLLPVCRASCLLGSQSPPRSQEARHPFITLPLLTAQPCTAHVFLCLRVDMGAHHR